MQKMVIGNCRKPEIKTNECYYVRLKASKLALCISYIAFLLYNELFQIDILNPFVLQCHFGYVFLFLVTLLYLQIFIVIIEC